MQQDNAQVLALQALGWLGDEEELLPRFLDAAGLAAGEVAACARDPEFLAAVLDFLLQEDAWIIAFCDAQGLPYAAPAAARASLPGGASLHWT